MYFASFDQDAGAVQGLRIIPMQARTMRLRHASQADSAWLRQILNEISRPFGTRIDAGSAGTLTAPSCSTLDATAEGAAVSEG
jgi:poly-gamma-glutamate synthesis protein (capsule biosynthesis protein)